MSYDPLESLRPDSGKGIRCKKCGTRKPPAKFTSYRGGQAEIPVRIRVCKCGCRIKTREVVESYDC